MKIDAHEDRYDHAWLNAHYLLGSHAGDISCRFCAARMDLDDRGIWIGEHHPDCPNADT